MTGKLPPSADTGDPSVRRRAVRYPNKTSFYKQGADADRMRAAFLNTREQTGFGWLSDFINAAVDEKVTGLEQVHNEGRPWQPLGAREIPQGKPAGRPAADRETPPAWKALQNPESSQGCRVRGYRVGWLVRLG